MILLIQALDLWPLDLVTPSSLTSVALIVSVCPQGLLSLASSVLTVPWAPFLQVVRATADFGPSKSWMSSLGPF